MLVEKKIHETVEHLRSKGVGGASKGLLLDSGMGGFSNELSRLTVVPQAKIPNFPRPLSSGRGGVLLFGGLGGEEVVVQEGRASLYEGYFHREIAFPLRVLAAVGVRKLIMAAWVRPLSPESVKGPFVLIEDHLNITGGSPLRGLLPGEGESFPLDMGNTYSLPLGEAARAVARRKGLPLDSGVAALVAGPEMPTPAEAALLSGRGACVFSTSLAPEVSMARFLGLEIVVLGVVHKPPRGRGDDLAGEDWGMTHLEFMRDLLEGL